MSNPFDFQVRLAQPYEEAVETVIAALKEEGFGVLTRVDVRATFQQKLEADFRPYVILGACNPPLAYRAMQADARVGRLLPCNVTVEADGDGALVAFVNPEPLLISGPLAENAEIRAVAAEARRRLERVAQSLKGR